MRTNLPYQTYFRNGLRMLLLFLFVFTVATSRAQINIHGKVFGGACQADVGGSTFVDISADHFDVVINAVYGGNDVSGSIGTDATAKVLPFTPEVNTDTKTYIDNTFDSFIRTNLSDKKIFIGKLFGGGDGNYDYTSATLSDGETDNPYYGMSSPVIGKTYLQINGGTFGQLFGGGNNATVTSNTTICIDNTSTVVNSIKEGNTELLTDTRIQEMNLNTTQTNVEGSFQFGRVFGGNNFADMAIRPRWFLKKGKIRDLYSGGNEGRMTSPEGLLLQIDADNPNAATTDPDVLWIDNVYGGCRKADVRPEYSYPNAASVPVPTEEIKLPDEDNPGQAPAGYAARVRVLGGYVNNVYGGNDISGTVYGGNTVGIFTTIHGNVYGGGNGSYAYTDQASLKDDPQWGDFYYNPGSSSVAALNAHRPNAERVSIRVSGTEAKPTIVEGALYVGGNSATLEKKSADIARATAELKIGSYVIIDKVFLGNNGENMVEQSVLGKYADANFSSLKLVGEGNVFDTYMDGCAMKIDPNVVFDDGVNSPDIYKPYSTQFGSFYCGGNVGSIIKDGLVSVDFEHEVIIYDKLVAGCNNANVAESSYNAAYVGGVKGSYETPEAGKTIGNKLRLNLSGLKIQPKRWVDENDRSKGLEWNTFIGNTKDVIAANASTDSASNDDLNRRFKGGNIYGGCYSSGIVNGNVIININATIVDRDILFDEVETDDETGEDKLYGNTYTIKQRHSGVILGQQGMDVLGKALNVFGGGKGKDTEIWGSATVNLNAGYTFQIFGGSEEGAIGKKGDDGNYTYNSAYSTYVNLSGSSNHPGVPKSKDTSDEMAQIEFMYGGGFEGPIAGDTHINLGNGRIFNTFAGSCNADIYGHTETYIGVNGFPYVRDYVYGGNDLGGKILGEGKFWSRVRDDDDNTENGNGTLTKIHGYDASSEDKSDVLKASAYIEYQQGRVEKIFGGCYGVYDYTNPLYGQFFYASGGTGTTDSNKGTARTGYSKPWMDNAFINFRPSSSNSEYNAVGQIYGAGQGYFGEKEENKMQNRSYILVDIPQSMQAYQSTVVFGGGECGGVGIDVDLSGDAPDYNKASAIIDLLRGDIKNVYGGSYREGVTRRTVVNVPEGSTIKVNNIFGGAYGTDTYHPCDVYEANVNYHSANAIVEGAIFGGNNNERRTIYGKVNIYTPVYNGSYDKTGTPYLGTVYGAGFGGDTWSEYTEVNLESGARVYEVYGGGQAGKVHNAESVQKVMNGERPDNFSDADWKYAWTLGERYDPSTFTFSENSTSYVDNEATNLENSLVRTAEMDDRTTKTNKYNTNVIIKQGAEVTNYAYGGGLGAEAVVAGTTYIALLGGTVGKDIYAAGTSGSVEDLHGAKNFIASANVYIEGGTARNVYGGGWEGSVGHHTGGLTASDENDIPGETHVVIGKLDGTDFFDGIPAIKRNAYGGGEGGAVFGTANITINNGFVGYVRFENEPTTDVDLEYIKNGSDYYQEKLHDETWKGDGTNRLYDSGCVFGGGYIDNSNVDVTNVKMLGGHVRNALFGGGEIAAIGRGVINASGPNNSVRTLQGIYKAGKTHVELLDGYVHRNVFGGGRGYNNLGEGGTLYSDGFVFGQTEVNIFGGEIGTAKELEMGNGNVFGGGDIGYVYSAYEYEESGVKKLGRGIKSGNRYDNVDEGYYYKKQDDAFVLDGTEKVPTEDCKVLVEPHCKVLAPVTINNHDYVAGDYVTTDDLNTMGNKNADQARWNCLDGDGIIIYNAVFAGGNTSAGSVAVYANATSVFSNATASIHDVYHRDLITVGTGHTGGLYGDGNLTFVDGYRGLNITNYGTDYYTISKEISLADYKSLPAREAAYYELRYKCKIECTDNEGKTYTVGSTITSDELITLFKNVNGSDGNPMVDASGKPREDYWEENGVCSRYAGRLMNTIQRADFCGVFGSRMVMQGAQDRVPEIVDYTNYTINRVREVSLNKQESKIATDTDDKAIHGNYFGIYNIVNYLGALSSDVHFTDVRETENTDADTYKSGIEVDGTTYAYGNSGATYYNWKRANINHRKRNNGSSYNKVALASGVYLELTTEESTGNDLYEKEWGYITGIIELDLINVQTGIGGGFVYAKNEHRTWTYNKKKHATLTALNKDAITRKDFDYDDHTMVEWETSGNFVHSTQTIIDDCYNISGKYKKPDAVPAHYWYIKGQVYVYDQFISAYTGAPNAYSETVDIPLTITAASHGTMKLLNVMPNKYAYYASSGVKLQNDREIVINDVTYKLNTPISYWDWYKLSSSEKSLFVDQTYVCIADCKIGETTYTAGTVLLPDDYTSLRPATGKVYHIGKQEDVDYEFVFRSSNNLSHDTGYILTYKVNNPIEWNTWYTKTDGNSNEKQREAATGYEDGPSYHLSSGTASVLGQREYSVGNIISQDVYTTYQNINTYHPGVLPNSGQAEFEPAYIVTSDVTYSDGGQTTHLNPGASVSQTDANKPALAGHVDEAYICTSTIQLSKTEFIYLNTKMSATERAQYISNYPDVATDINKYVVPAYYCTTDGLYGGNYYEAGKNYRALEAWCSMSETDRSSFTFNYDALDLLIDPGYSKAEGQKYQYDGLDFTTEEQARTNPAGYSLSQPVDYTATFIGTSDLTYTDKNGSSHTIVVGANDLTRVEYEAIPNEQRHYAPIVVKETGTYYVVNKNFQDGSTPYAAGSIISSSVYNSISNKGNVTQLNFTSEHVGKTYYFCRESYEIGENGEGHAVTAAAGIENGVSGSYSSGHVVPLGLVIDATTYGQLTNKQTNFTIHGIAPTETSTLFVSRNSDIFDLSTEKILTVIYEYNYEESDVSGNVTPVSERHVVNIHIQFKSGVPSVEDIRAPQTIIPGDKVALREPNVTPGAYEVTGGGWEIFEKIGDAESHINGIEYSPATDPLYWYQNDYYVAYYAKTYLGKTYSNHVQVSVANYHDLKKVLETPNHYYVDHDGVERDSKIYINDYTNSQNGLDLLKYFVNLTYGEGTSTYGALQSPDRVKGAKNLDIILRTNINYTDAWEPIANGEKCFSGTLHGDGYYISGLTNSLFDNLCGNVYNLGVTGSFTTAGVANSGDGYVENCWINTTGTPSNGVRAVFGNPTSSDGFKIVNCYYPNSLAYSTEDNGRGLAKPVPENDFYNGTVAYNLNGFYLYKRYNDKTTNSGVSYKFYTISSTDNSLSDPIEKYYAQNFQYSSAGATTVYEKGGYVEDRYGNEDFQYANGSIPSEDNERIYFDPATNVTSYYPIWPDDYIYFGQMLTYDWNEARPHEEVPSPIVKSSGRLLSTDQSNRVYRAPAYYGNKNMSVAHFNPSVNLVSHSKPENAADLNTHPAYPGMTAIDFAGHNDATYQLGLNGSLFYQPLLDDDGLISIVNRDETPNLLVYAPASGKTYNVLADYFKEPVYSQYYINDVYRRVKVAPTPTIYGHLVLSNKTSAGDHLLVDKQDFNCPIGYKMGENNVMWYQREPQNFVTIETATGKSKGWEDISLPFTAELVTTQDKGEITHFFQGSTEGHEYWLRVYDGIDATTSTTDELAAKFTYPATAESGSKSDANTFLYDYYYGQSESKDANSDIYKSYYNGLRTYDKYPYLKAGSPYLIGFPGVSYYEFDLSGNFEAKNTYAAITKLGTQTITFASDAEAPIGVSDDEMASVEKDNYIFYPNYQNKELASGDFLLNSSDGGNKYKKLTASKTALPFRPYFMKKSGAQETRGEGNVNSIIFSGDMAQMNVPKAQNQLGGDDDLIVTAGKKKICVESQLRYTTDVRIVTPAGVTLAAYSIQSSEYVETQVYSAGVYIVYADNGKYVKKVIVK